VFKLGDLGLGYYVDDLGAAAHAAIKESKLADPMQVTQYIVGAPASFAQGAGASGTCISLDDLVPGDVSPLKSRRKPRNIPRKRRRRQQRNGVTAPRPMMTLLGESKLCEDHREFGFWAIDSLNCNAISTGQSFLEATTAAVVLL